MYRKLESSSYGISLRRRSVSHSLTIASRLEDRHIATKKSSFALALLSKRSASGCIDRKVKLFRGHRRRSETLRHILTFKHVFWGDAFAHTNSLTSSDSRRNEQLIMLIVRPSLQDVAAVHSLWRPCYSHLPSRIRSLAGRLLHSLIHTLHE
jgi:hypothetical protein